jgi:glutamyl-tRNA synthetase
VAAVAGLVKERCYFINEIWDHGFFFFQKPDGYDEAAVKPKWNAAKEAFFREWAVRLETLAAIPAAELEADFKALAAEKGLKVGEVLLPFRIMLTGGKFGPPVFDIAVTLGAAETRNRIETALEVFKDPGAGI